MARSKSSHRWLKEHFTDKYVKRAQKEGYRSRAAYKLIEIQEKDKLFRPGMVVIDLGAAPGGWSQLLIKWVQPKGRVIAIDILEMAPISQVEVLQGDFQDQAVIDQLKKQLGTDLVDVVISDMAPNTTGVRAVDQPRSMFLAELALDFALQVLRAEGNFLIKLFQGEGSESFIRMLRQHFKKVFIRKPSSSRSRSREIYLVGTGFKKVSGQQN
jgi:23S rRNA (uridine2552-2'-O)-methyltransferase